MNEAKSFIEILKEHVSSEKAKLPAFNRTGLAIQQEMARPDPDMQVIEKQILRDPALAGQLLKVANSSFYRGMIEVTTVRNAMVRLGLAEVSNLVTLLTQKQSFTTQDPSSANTWISSGSTPWPARLAPNGSPRNAACRAR
jgi:HD-like signal output (HDOD) protein